MTAEIGILNRQGVALAADSAVTISINGKEKILNSANKLFNLVKGKPIGFMVYGNGSFMGLPWEVIVDSYRTTFDNDKSGAYLKDICDDFIKKLAENTDFHNETSSFQLIYNKLSAFLEKIIIETQDTLSHMYPNIQVDESKALAVFDEILNRYIEEYQNLEYSINFEQYDFDEIYNKCEHIVDDLCKYYIQFSLSSDVFDKIKQVCSLLMCKDIMFNFSGIVIAGYGDNEILPQLYSLAIEGIINGKLKYKLLKASKIGIIETDNESIAEIVPFAQQEMVHSILSGMDPALQDFMYEKIVNSYSNIINKSLTDDEEYNNKITQFLSAQFEEIRSEITKFQQINFVNPVLNMVAMLNKDELATMAENLVNITSFKRKFTTETETVGGPIDVAVISKADGFIWIKRKHYFKSELNHTFFNINN